MGVGGKHTFKVRGTGREAKASKRRKKEAGCGGDDGCREGPRVLRWLVESSKVWDCSVDVRWVMFFSKMLHKREDGGTAVGGCAT